MELHKSHISIFKFVFVMVGMVISGQYFGWNGGFEQATPSSYFIAVIILVIFFSFFMFSCGYLVNHYMDKEKSLPDLVSVVLGKKLGYLCGWACVFEYWLGTPAIAISFAIYLNELVPFVNYPVAVLIGFLIVLFANIGSLNHIAKYETIATVLAILGVFVFYVVIISVYFNSDIEKVAPFSQPIEFNGIAYAIPFAIWLFLGIEGGITLIHAMKKPKKEGFIGIAIGLVILAVLALVTVFFFICYASTSGELLSTDPLPNLIKNLNFPFISNVILLLGLFGLLASFNGLTIGYSQQLYLLGNSYKIKMFKNNSRLLSKATCLFVPLLIAFICCLSNDLSQNFVIMAVLSALVVYLFVTVSIVLLFMKLGKYILAAVYAAILLLLILIIIFTFIYAIMPAQISFIGLDVNVAWILSAAFIIVILTSFKIKS